MRVLASPVETGAVTICLPEDVQAEAWDFPRSFFEEKTYSVPRPAADERAVHQAAAALRAARRPFLVAGGGVRYSEAEAALAALVESTGIPAGVTQAGKGTLPDEHACCAGGIGATGTLAANELARAADLVIAAGTRLSDFTTASKTLFREDALFVSVQIDPHDAHKHGALPLLGDARAVLEQLAGALAGWRVAGEWAAAIADARGRWDAARRAIVEPGTNGGAARRLRQAEVIGVLNERLPPDATIVHAAGGLPGDLHKLWRCRSPREYHSEYGYSCMGYEIAGALGVKMARPEREVYALAGDGSYLMLHSELVTSLQEDRKITVVLIDNGGYQCIHGLQRQCGGRSFGNEFRKLRGGRLEGDFLPIDYAANAASLGAAAFRAETGAELADAIAAARAETRSVLIHVAVEVGPPVPSWAWWEVPAADASIVPGVREARERWAAARAEQRYYYRGSR
jgi:3D-(3,5/4)-trihydroxycyclohexane-1,2-dione acylhydrolase (decyclizing)